MERVTFLIEETGERIACMLNPESLVIRRLAGVRPRRSAGGVLTGAGLADDALLFTGGGMTELHLNLLFDVSLAGSTAQVKDVRDLTFPLWKLAENAAEEQSYGRPPLIRFVWGKTWNIPGIVAAIAERLDYFTSEGDALRSWLRMRFLRVAEPGSQPVSGQKPPGSVEIPETPTPEQPGPEGTAPTETAADESRIHQYVLGERLDQLAYQYYGYYGHPSLWRKLAIYNGINDPWDIPAGALLRIPPLSLMEGKR
ncbi:MAG TPA: hypothetical protein VE842_15355 [Pyrinomonadaceae bacterium]|nr:hypothetical protein [Pyrinomonadaceae bacterium]